MTRRASAATPIVSEIYPCNSAHTWSLLPYVPVQSSEKYTARDIVGETSILIQVAGEILAHDITIDELTGTELQALYEQQAGIKPAPEESNKIADFLSAMKDGRLSSYPPVAPLKLDPCNMCKQNKPLDLEKYPDRIEATSNIGRLFPKTERPSCCVSSQPLVATDGGETVVAQSTAAGILAPLMWLSANKLRVGQENNLTKFVASRRPKASSEVKDEYRPQPVAGFALSELVDKLFSPKIVRQMALFPEWATASQWKFYCAHYVAAAIKSVKHTCERRPRGPESKVKCSNRVCPFNC